MRQLSAKKTLASYLTDSYRADRPVTVDSRRDCSFAGSVLAKKGMLERSPTLPHRIHPLEIPSVVVWEDYGHLPGRTPLWGKSAESREAITI